MKSRKPQTGRSKNVEYGIWYKMLDRVLNTRDAAYEKYGGRGITVCDEWRNSFEAFLLDMGTRPTPLHTLERIDNNKGYTKENCKWATRKEQTRNRRNTVLYKFDGGEYTLLELCEKYSINYNMVKSRLRILKWDINKALFTSKIKPGLNLHPPI